MEKIIHKYLDKMEDLTEEVDKDIDTLMTVIDIESILIDPVAELKDIVFALINKMKQDYHPRAAKAGIDLAKDIKNGSI